MNGFVAILSLALVAYANAGAIAAGPALLSAGIPAGIVGGYGLGAPLLNGGLIGAPALAAPLGLRSIGAPLLSTGGLIGAPVLSHGGLIGAPALGLRTIGAPLLSAGLATPIGVKSVAAAPLLSAAPLGLGLASPLGLGLASPLGLRTIGGPTLLSTGLAGPAIGVKSW